MALRIRSNGDIVCAAKHEAEDGDTYLDDGISYRLSVDYHVIVTEPMFLPEGEGLGGHAEHGRWWWDGDEPAAAVIDRWWQ